VADSHDTHTTRSHKWRSRNCHGGCRLVRLNVHLQSAAPPGYLTFGSRAFPFVLISICTVTQCSHWDCDFKHICQVVTSIHFMVVLILGACAALSDRGISVCQSAEWQDRQWIRYTASGLLSTWAC
jgi:hypothetical protein